MTRAYEDLKYRTGNVVACDSKSPDINIYRVGLDLYPSAYQLKQHLTPIIFAEEELEFEDSSKERDWRINQILK